MKRIEAKADAFVAASAALDLIRAIQSSGINFGDDAIDVSLASARADLEFVCHSWARPLPDRCECGDPLPHTEKSK